MELTEEQIRKVAHLARIHVDEGDLLRLRQNLTQVLDWIEMLNEVNTEGIEPMSSVHLDHMPMRPDVINDGGRPDDILRNAPEKKHQMFVVPKVVE